MNIPKKTHELIRQNEQIVKKSQKHDANLQKNSTLYFQVGLIVCLLAAYGLLEMNFQTIIPNSEYPIDMRDDFAEVSVEKFKVYEEQVKEVIIEPKKKVVLSNPPKIVEDDFKLKKAIEIISGEQNTSSEKPLDPGAIIVIDEPTIENVPFKFIEEVPIYPGCENKKTNDDRRKCMSEKITKLVQRKFNTELGSELGLSGKQVIQTQFKIDKTGRVIDVKTRFSTF